MGKRKENQNNSVLVFSYFILLGFYKEIVLRFMRVLVVMMIVIMPFSLDLFVMIQELYHSRQIYDDMPDDCREIYDMYSNKQYETISISGVKIEDGCTELYFKDKTTERASFSDMNAAVNDLLLFQRKSGKTENTELTEFIFKPCSNYGADIYKISNCINLKYYPELDGYETDSGKWWVFKIHYKNWKELEDNYSYATGISECHIYDLSGLDDADASKWENLEYLHLYYYGDDAEYYEQELQNLFPNAEVHVGAEIDW